MFLPLQTAPLLGYPNHFPLAKHEAHWSIRLLGKMGNGGKHSQFSCKVQENACSVQALFLPVYVQLESYVKKLQLQCFSRTEKKHVGSPPSSLCFLRSSRALFVRKVDSKHSGVSRAKTSCQES